MPILTQADYHVITTKPRAHLHITGSATGSILVANTWQKLDLSSATSQVMETQGGFTWDDINKRIVWDSGSVLGFPITVDFVGDAQVQITSGVSGSLVLELGLVLNGNITPPLLITPTTYTNQAKISSYGANDSFSLFTGTIPGDSRLNPNDYLEVWIRCTHVSTLPDYSVDGFNVTFKAQ